MEKHRRRLMTPGLSISCSLRPWAFQGIFLLFGVVVFASCYLDPRVFLYPNPGVTLRTATAATVKPVVVSRDPPPPHAEHLGDITIYSQVSNLGMALSYIRRQARRLGGTLVASLVCRPHWRLREAVYVDFKRTEPLFPGERIQCYGGVYRPRAGRTDAAHMCGPCHAARGF